MSPAGLALSAILVLGLMCMCTASPLYADQDMAAAQDAGAPLNYPQLASVEEIRAQDTGAGSPMGNTQFASEEEMQARSENYPYYGPRELAEMQARPQEYLYRPIYVPHELAEMQQQCMGTHVPVRAPYVSVDVCSVTPNQCGWVKVDVGGTNFLGMSLGARVTVDVRVCDQNGNLCYNPVSNDCSRIRPGAIKIPVKVPVTKPKGDIVVSVNVQLWPKDVCIQVHLPRCRSGGPGPIAPTTGPTTPSTGNYWGNFWRK